MLRRTLLTRGYYFVDASVIKYSFITDPKVEVFLKEPCNKFFYTEAVKQDIGDFQVNERFKFVESKLPDWQRKLAFMLISDYKHNLTDTQLNAIFEASSIQFREDIVPLNDLTLSNFLTMDIEMNEELEKNLNEVGNLVGFDFCIEIVNLRLVALFS